MEAFEISEDLVQSPTHKAAGVLTTDLDGLLSSPLRLEEDLAGGCGGQVWVAGIVLAKYMLRNHVDLRGKSIVELGAGGGLVGLAVAKGCRTNRPILITDQIPMLQLMEWNIALNDLSDHAQALVYDWGTPTPPSVPKHPDVILAADCVYYEPAFPLLEKTLLDLVGEDTVCYFCFKKRRRADLLFMKRIKKLLTVQPAEEAEVSQEYNRDGVFLYKITAKTSHSPP